MKTLKTPDEERTPSSPHQTTFSDKCEEYCNSFVSIPYTINPLKEVIEECKLQCAVGTLTQQYKYVNFYKPADDRFTASIPGQTDCILVTIYVYDPLGSVGTALYILNHFSRLIAGARNYYVKNAPSNSFERVSWEYSDSASVSSIRRCFVLVCFGSD